MHWHWFVLVPLLGIPGLTWLIFKVVSSIANRFDPDDGHESDGGA